MSEHIEIRSGAAPGDTPSAPEVDIRDVVRQAIEEFVSVEHRKAEPAYKAELHEERKRREGMEAR